MRWPVFTALTLLTVCTSYAVKISKPKEVIEITMSAGKYTAARINADAYPNLEKQKYGWVYPILKISDVSGSDELFDLAYRGTDLGYHLFINMAQAKEISPATYTAVALLAKDCRVDRPFSMLEELNSRKKQSDRETKVIFKNGKCYVEVK